MLYEVITDFQLAEDAGEVGRSHHRHDLAPGTIADVVGHEQRNNFV